MRLRKYPDLCGRGLNPTNERIRTRIFSNTLTSWSWVQAVKLDLGLDLYLCFKGTMSRALTFSKIWTFQFSAKGFYLWCGRGPGPIPKQREFEKRGWTWNPTCLEWCSSFPCLMLPKLLVANGALKYLLDFYLRNKTCFPCLHSLVKTEANVWENSRADQWKPETLSRVFTCSRILPNFRLDFHQAMKARKSCFIS